MKHLILTIAALLSAVGAMAQTEHLSAALHDFLSQKGVKTTSSETINTENLWAVIQYSFTVADGDKWNDMLQKFTEAYHKDMAGAEFAHMADAGQRMNGTAFVFYSKPHENEPPVLIGADKSYNLIVVRKKNTATNKRDVFAIEWRQQSEAKKSACEGNIYVISGSSDLSQERLQGEKYQLEKSNTLTDRQRRMLFYQEKAEKDGMNEAIMVGAFMAVEDIANNGTQAEIATAKTVLDALAGSIKIPEHWDKDYLMQSRQYGMIKAIRKAQEKLLSAKGNPEWHAAAPTFSPNGGLNTEALEQLLKNPQNSTFNNLPWYKATPEPAPKPQLNKEAVDELLKNAKDFGIKGNFTLAGKKDDELWDVGYYIYKANDNFTFADDKHDDVRVENNGFLYVCDLKDITWGKVNAIMMDGTICSAWIEIPFVPGELAELHVHNGYYSLSGTSFYKEWVKADTDDHTTAQDIIDNHLSEYGYICYCFKSSALSSKDKQQIWNKLPKKIQDNHIGRFLKKFM
ncbi:MAG: hypothetical protein HUK08_09590 [Bacteroidaceae bacterium]|nr:hypothetical protein [Bacteroidaceae bacterium]